MTLGSASLASRLNEYVCVATVLKQSELITLTSPVAGSILNRLEPPDSWVIEYSVMLKFAVSPSFATIAGDGPITKEPTGVFSEMLKM